MSNAFKSNTYGQEGQESSKSGSKDSTSSFGSSGSDKSTSVNEKVRDLSSSSKDKREGNRDYQSEDRKMDFDSIERKMEEYGSDLKKKGQYLSRQVIDQIKRNPWAYVGGVSVASWAIGYFMGRRRTSSN